MNNQASLFSIIIPTYNSNGKIQKALDSIYSQGINMDLFEVICVDDCSPDPSSIECIQKYKAEHHLHNLQVIVHKENRRQGGARNTGVKHASGKYIQFIDQDDYFAENALKKIVKQLNAYDIDMIMWDHTFHKYHKITPNLYSANHDRIVDGMTFIIENEYTWAPWGYSYRREFLLENDLKFVECVQFEDTDFVSLCISKAKSIQYKPFSLIHYTVNKDSQTNVGSESKQKMDFFFQLSNRTIGVAKDIKKQNIKAGNKVWNIGEICYIAAIKRLVQYRNSSGRYDLIKTHVAGRFNNSTSTLLRNASKHPILFTYICPNIKSYC